VIKAARRACRNGSASTWPNFEPPLRPPQ
jgi:hypothetical protein